MSDSPYLDALRRRNEKARQVKSDMEKYEGWLDGAAKTAQVNFRISKADLAAFKALARARGRRYQTHLVELIQREIRSDEGEGARSGTGRLKATRMREPY